MTSKDFFENVQSHHANELPFVMYRKPFETQLSGLFQNDAQLHLTSDYSESGFVFAPFDAKEQSILIPMAFTKSIKIDIDTSHYTKTSDDKLPRHSKLSETQKQFHINLVQKAIETITQNEVQKIVISRKEDVLLENANPIAIFKNLLDKYHSAFVYCWFHPKVGLWLGATPETLLNIEGNRLTTMALAGTQKFVDTEDVIWQKKEKEEQQFVTDFIVESLQSSVSKIQICETKTLKAGNLLHLKTDIKANLKPGDLNLQQIIKNLHPTPAVCGLPKESAKEFILKNENYNREFYTGFLGELNLKEKTSRNSNRHNVENDAYATIKKISNIYVNLRCMQLKDNHAIIYIGGGITKHSISENEWEETVSKSEVIKSVL